MAFPGNLPSFAGFTASNTLAQDNHAAQHNSEQSEIVAIATKLGTGASTPSAGTVLRGTGAGASAFGQVALASEVSGVLPVANGGTGATSASDARDNLGLGNVNDTSDATKNAAAVTLTNKTIDGDNNTISNLSAAWPIDSIFISVSSTNPATSLGFGTWVAFGEGKVLVGLDSGDTDFDTVEETGGAKTHTLTTAEMPAHTHSTNITSIQDTGSGLVARTQNVGSTAATTSAGGGDPHNNLQPYITVYMWKRTA